MEIVGESTNDSIRPYVYGYKGASIFASSVPKSTYDTLRASFPDGKSSTNIFIYDSVDAKNDSLLGIRYYISIDGKIKDHPELTEIGHSGECFLYENPYDGSIGYMLFDDASEGSSANNNAQLDIKEMEGNRLTGSIDAPKDGVLLITIPYDDGWKVRLDGSEAKDFESENGFISIEVEQGTHTVDMRYTSSGCTVGALLSLLGLAIFLLRIYRAKDMAGT